MTTAGQIEEKIPAAALSGMETEIADPKCASIKLGGAAGGCIGDPLGGLFQQSREDLAGLTAFGQIERRAPARDVAFI
jgi:hypothetical protein